MISTKIRERFVHYYQNHGCEVLLGNSLLDPSVPMTFVMSAGLTQIEATVDRSEKHAGERYVLVQTCFRHFDLEKIGLSPVHLSLFEMGGAFSFGQTSREETLGAIWDYLTTGLGFRGEQLQATFFAGGEMDGYRLEKDVETIQAWQKIGLSSSQILEVGIEAGFWKQGGGLSGVEHYRKCGPTTELFFDRGPAWSCGPGCRPGCKCGRFVEIANVLFIDSQFDQMSRSLKRLVTPFDETVIGVERLVMALQGKTSVFELECLAPLIRLVRSHCRASDLLDLESAKSSEQIIADHVRALLFLVADGAPAPGKGGRAWIIRKLIRGTLTSQNVLGISEDEFIPGLIDTALELYHDQYPDLRRGRDELLSFFAMEGERFERTLSAGYRRLDQLLRRGRNGFISGKDALELVKQKGFPLSLLEATLAQRGIKLNWREYGEAHERWRRKVLETV